MRRFARLASVAVVLVLAVAACTRSGDPGAAGKRILRLGHFPNVTHAQALVAHALSRQGKGWFEERLGPGTRIEWFVYNAGPSAMEAILAGSLDLTYVGPNPALNAHIKSGGKEVRVLAGATAIVVHEGFRIDRVFAIDVRDGRIAGVRGMLNPDKLRYLERARFG